MSKGIISNHTNQFLPMEFYRKNVPLCHIHFCLSIPLGGISSSRRYFLSMEIGQYGDLSIPLVE
uniref:Uncharacterized protein n=1 Tax=Picea sitchensis TaxID=3332 RepID=A0A6B9XV20_PICSI|nr:hypothetical protein Q903MT_gene4128 [Picea sitchensis]